MIRIPSRTKKGPRSRIRFLKKGKVSEEENGASPSLTMTSTASAATSV